MGRLGDSDSHAAVEVHSVDANSRVVLDTQIDMFTDTEAEVSRSRKILFPQLVFLHFQTSLYNFLCFGSPNCDMNSDLLIAANAECSDSISGFACRSCE